MGLAGPTVSFSGLDLPKSMQVRLQRSYKGVHPQAAAKTLLFGAEEEAETSATRTRRRRQLGHQVLSLRDEKAQAEQIRSVDVQRIGAALGTVPGSLMADLDAPCGCTCRC